MYILLPAISAGLCCCSGLWLKICGILILLGIQIINLIHSNKQDKEIRKISAYDKAFQTQYDDKEKIKNVTFDGGIY